MLIAWPFFAVAASFALPPFAAAQQHDQAIPSQLNALAFMAGDWSGKQNFNTQGGAAMVGDVTDHAEMVVGGRFIEERLTTVIGSGAPHDVRHITTFDPKANRFRAWWFNDTSVDPMVFEGTLTGNVLVMETAPGGSRVMRATYEKQSDTQLAWKLEMKTKTGWMELFHTTYTKS